MKGENAFWVLRKYKVSKTKKQTNENNKTTRNAGINLLNEDFCFWKFQETIQICFSLNDSVMLLCCY